MSDGQPTPDPSHWEDVSIPLTDLLQSAGRAALALLVVPLLLHVVLWGGRNLIAGIFRVEVLLLALPVTLAFIVLHEVIHMVGWKVFSGLPWKAFSFGFDRKTLSPYCHAHEPMRAWAYRIGAALPGRLAGVLPVLVGFLNADGAWTLLGAFMTSAAVGDLYVLTAIRSIPNSAQVIDHPENAGCYVLIES
jgi:hypothetical protein